MATEILQKLEPHRTMMLRGFDRRGSAGALHHASATGFKVSGVFRDAADFCVAMLYDADDFFAHPAIKYLPSFDFTGQTLTFDVIYDNLQPLDSPKFPSISWPYIEVVRKDGTTAQVRIFDYAMKQGGTFAAASQVFTLNGTPVGFDRVQLWYQNNLFDFPFSVIPETAAMACTNLASQINGTNWSSLGPDIALRAVDSSNTLTITAARYGVVSTAGTAVTWVSGNKFVGASGSIQINGILYTISSVTDATHLTLTATAGTQTSVSYLADRGGIDGNRVGIYELHKTGTAFFTPAATTQLNGGDSATPWRVTLPFNTLVDKNNVSIGTDIRQMWFTFAPLLANSAAYADQEWSAEFSNWSVTDASSTRALRVAGAGSVRVDSRDTWATYDGVWSEEAGFFQHGFAHRTSTTGNKVTILYHCQYTHDLYLGTSLYSDRGIVVVNVDGAAQPEVDMYLNNEPAVVTRRVLKSSIPAGAHTVILTLKASKNASSSGFNFYFDFLEAAVVSDVLDPATTYSDRSAASDFDTDHGYKLSPQRLVWLQHRLGLRGDWNHYAGVFWWNQRKRLGGKFHEATVTFSGTFTAGTGFGGGCDSIFLIVGGQTIGKSVYPADTLSTIAAHFVAYINETFVGIWASSVAGVLTITTLSPIYDFTFSTSFTPTAGSTGVVTATGDLNTGTEGTWIIDDTVTPVINRAATDWHADFCAELALYSLTGVIAFSQELLNPPEAPTGGGDIWIQRYYGGNPVLTATGFGTEGAGLVEAYSAPTVTMTGHGYSSGNSVNIGLGTWTITRVDDDNFGLSTLTAGTATLAIGDAVTRNLQTAQCAFSAVRLAYIKQAYAEMAGLMDGAALTPWLQFGEILHWFFSDFAGSVTGATNASPVSITVVGHGRVTGENIIIAGVRGNTGANGTWSIVVTDANHFTLTGSHGSGSYIAGSGRAVGGSMALYDADQAAAALVALGRPLARFYTQDDDPAINSHADADFLASRIKDYTDAVSSYVLATYAGAKFELLWPYDVCYKQAYYSADLPFPQGGRLNRYINLPAAFNTKAGSGLDRIKMEALSWGTFYRNLTNAEETILFPYTVLSWAKADTRYLLPWFNGGTPWTAEHIFTRIESTPHVNFWAFDHLTLLSWPLDLPVPQAISRSV